MGPFVFILFGTLCSFCACMSVSFFKFEKFSDIVSSVHFYLLPHSHSRNPVIQRLTHFVLSHRSDNVLLYFFICLSVCYSDWVIFIILSSRQVFHSSLPFSQLFIVSRLLFIWAIELSFFLIGSSLDV